MGKVATKYIIQPYFAELLLFFYINGRHIYVYIKITYMEMYLKKNQKKIITKINDLILLYIFLKNK